MEVKKGYKQTEAGVIPEDWDIRPLGSVVTFLDGQRRPVKDSDRAKMRGEIPYYGASGIVDYVNDYLFDDDLILLGEDGENIVSRNTRLAFRVYGKIWVNNHAHVLKPLPHISIGYLTDFLESLNYESYNSGTAQPKLNKQTCYKIPVALPPTLAEQEAIAEALSDADALIESLETLLAKKRQVKQGAIQELLTGRKRLLGFEKKRGNKESEVGAIPADWISVSIAELCGDKDGSIKIGPFGSQLKREYLVSSGYKVYGQENVYAQDINIGDRYLTKEHFQKLKSCELLPGDFIVSMMGTIGQCMIVPDNLEQGIIDSHLIRIRPNPKMIVLEYLSYYYSSKLVFDQISRLQVGGIMAGLSSTVIKQIYIGLPNSIEEQTAIAEILSDMDAEIRAVEEKLSKARAVKAGMMSALLTGRTRLVESGKLKRAIR